MATIIAGQPIPQTGQPVALFSLRGGLTLTAISGGSVDIADAGASDSLDTLTVDGVDILGGSVAWATSDVVFGRAITRQINAQNSDYWATFDGTSKVIIWPRDGTESTGALTVTGTDTGFTPTYVDMNSEQAFVAAYRWPSVNLGADAIADTKMYQIGFDYSNFAAIDSSTLTGFKAVELVLQTEDATLDVYIGPEGKVQLSATPADNDIEERTFAVLGCALGTQRMFIQSGGAQNPVYHVRGW